MTLVYLIGLHSHNDGGGGGGGGGDGDDDYDKDHRIIQVLPTCCDPTPHLIPLTTR